MTEFKDINSKTILYSFRRCPYAMRARLALVSAQISFIIREVSLKDKPIELKLISKKATVPCLQTATTVIPESLEIMRWALLKNDPENLLDCPAAGVDLINYNDGRFKTCIDRTKYRSHYKDVQLEVEQKIAKEFLTELNSRLTTQFILSDKKTIVDIALFPFVRQYAQIDKNWFNSQNWHNLNNWLNSFINSESFYIIQRKYPIWKQGDDATIF